MSSNHAGKLRDELLNRERFLHIEELRYVVDRWRMDYNDYQPQRMKQPARMMHWTIWLML